VIGDPIKRRVAARRLAPRSHLSSAKQRLVDAFASMRNKDVGFDHQIAIEAANLGRRQDNDV